MFTIRDAQIARLGDNMRARFEAKMAAHLKRFFPEHCRRLGEGELGRFLAECIRSAAEHGIVAECDVCLLVDAMLLSGQWQGATLPWTKEVLQDARGRGASATAELLYDIAVMKSEYESDLTPEIESVRPED